MIRRERHSDARCFQPPECDSIGSLRTRPHLRCRGRRLVAKKLGPELRAARPGCRFRFMDWPGAPSRLRPESVVARTGASRSPQRNGLTSSIPFDIQRHDLSVGHAFPRRGVVRAVSFEPRRAGPVLYARGVHFRTTDECGSVAAARPAMRLRFGGLGNNRDHHTIIALVTQEIWPVQLDAIPSAAIQDGDFQLLRGELSTATPRKRWTSILVQ